MARIRILDPTAPPPEVDADPGPALGTTRLADQGFGIRFDLTWRSFLWVRDEWTAMLREEGARVAEWCAGDRAGEAGEQTEAEMLEFARAQDVVVVGLGN